MSDLKTLHEPIGSLVVSFATLESVVGLFLASLLDVHQDISLTLVAEMSFSKRLQTLTALAPLTIKDKQLCEELDSVVCHLAQSEERRNIIVHTTFLSGSNNNLMRFKITAKGKKGLQHNFQDATPTQIRQAVDHVEASKKSLGAYIRKIQDRGILSVKLIRPN